MRRVAKITPKEIKKPDKFRRAILKAIEFVSDNHIKLSLALLGILTVLIVSFFILHSLEQKRLRANSEFRKALQTYLEGNKAEALKEFLGISEKYPQAKISKIALYYAGAINYDLGNYDESIRILGDLIKRGIEDKNLKDAAYFTIGLSNFNKGNWQEAIDYLSKVEGEKSPYRSKAKLHIGLALEKLGQFNKAEKIYRELLIQETRGIM